MFTGLYAAAAAVFYPPKTWQKIRVSFGQISVKIGQIGLGRFWFDLFTSRRGACDFYMLKKYYRIHSTYVIIAFSGGGGGLKPLLSTSMRIGFPIDSRFRVYLVRICLFTGCNVIPLPPKDPRAVLQLTASKPRHQRKYPLIMPNSKEGGSSCQPTAVTNNHNQQSFSDQTVTHSECSYNDNGGVGAQDEFGY